MSKKMVVDEEAVRAAYRFFLKREPESEEVIVNHVKASSGFADLCDRFVGSPEFAKANWRVLMRSIAGAQITQKKGEIEYKCDDTQLAAIFQHIRNVWSKLGEEEPHFSVLSTPNFKPENIDQNLGSFKKSGAGEVGLMAQELRSHGLKDSGYKQGIELGCGVARLTPYLAEMADHVHGYDVSAPHLKLADEYLKSIKKANVSLNLISDLNNLTFPEYDLFYSRIVFQHNPPPVQFYILKKLLSSMLPGGVAVFQLPTALEGYTFIVDEYIQNMEKFDNQELHALPFKVVSRSVYEAGCELVSATRDGSLSNARSVSTRFVVQKL